MTNSDAIGYYQDLFISHLTQNQTQKEPANLYDPITYILGLGGKRMRPVLTLMSCDLFGGKVTSALDAALAVEVFHNISFVHDDIMYDSTLRLGKANVNEKWD
ncbi:MAG: polyprenyl synthetase family protein, partial [Bacteroidota bacterium]